MYSFLVLGLIPGTNLQINFQGWLNLLGLSLVAGTLLHVRMRRSLAAELINVRTPLHASQLHQRLHLTAQ